MADAQFVGVELRASSTLKPRLAARVKERAMRNGLLVLGLSGTIDGTEGESVVLAPVGLRSRSTIPRMPSHLDYEDFDFSLSALAVGNRADQ